MREPLQIGTAWGAPIRRVGFIKSDQTRGNSPVSWLPPHGNHFLPCHSSLSWLNSAPFVIVLRTSSSLGRLSVYRLSLLVDTKAGKQGEKQHRCVMKRRKHTVWPCAQERAHVAGQTYSMSVCVCVCVLCPSSIQQKKRLIFKIYFFCLHTGQSYFTIFCWQEQIKNAPTLQQTALLIILRVCLWRRPWSGLELHPQFVLISSAVSIEHRQAHSARALDISEWTWRMMLNSQMLPLKPANTLKSLRVWCAK